VDKSLDCGDGAESFAQTDRMDSFVGSMGFIQRVHHGAGLDTKLNTESEREGRPYRRGQTCLLLPRVEARAGSAAGRVVTSRMSPAPSACGSGGADTRPSTEAPWYWSEMEPERSFLWRREEASPQITDTNSSRPSQQNEFGPRDPSRSMSEPRGTSAGEEPSGGILDVGPSILVAGPVCDDASTPGGFQGLDSSTEGRTLVTISSPSSHKECRELVFQKLLLISVKDVWLISQRFGNPVCSVRNPG
jgi:hypothetical protein